MSGPSRSPGGAERAIGSYLAEIAAKLDGPASARRDIVAELATGIADAAYAHRYAGLDPAHATCAAIAEFGSPALVAAGFRDELAAATARRSTLVLLTIGPLAAALGYIASLASHIQKPAPPWDWVTLPTGALLATFLATVAMAAAIASTLYTLAATGRLSRWLPARPAASAAIAAGSAAAADLAMMAVLSIHAAATPGRLAALPLAAAGAASVVWLVMASRATRTCLAIRAAGLGAGG